MPTNLQLEVAPYLDQDYTEFKISLDASSAIVLQILDEAGALVWTLFSGHLEAGQHIFPIQSRQLDSGPYILKARTKEFETSTFLPFN